MMHIFAVRLLRATPAWMTQIVDGGSKQNVTPKCPELAAHRCAYPLLDLRLPGCSTRYPDGKRGCPLRASYPSRTIRHSEGRYAEPFDARSTPKKPVVGQGDGAFACHLRDLFVECHLGDELVDAFLDVDASAAGTGATGRRDGGQN